MSLGRSSGQSELFDDVAEYCESGLSAESIYSFLHRERDRLFPDEMFSDLYSRRGRRSVPPSVLAAVMVLQRLEGLSDYEAVERLEFDARWRYATGIGGFHADAVRGFVRTVLVYTRERLRRSEDPDRIFRVVLEAGKKAGLVGRKRVLDSTALYDSVSTMDTITLIRSAIRGVLRSLETDLCASVRSQFTSDDPYSTTSKPQIDWADSEARMDLIDSRARDGYACLEFLENRALSSKQREAVELLATVLGQDLEIDEEGRYRIARKVAKDRVISTVDPEARHGHKTAALVTPGNAGDGSVAQELVEDLLEDSKEKEDSHVESREVYGDGAYGTARFQAHLDSAKIDSYCKTPSPSSRRGKFGKEQFQIDLETQTVVCPAGVSQPIPETMSNTVEVRFGSACKTCPLRQRCTDALDGRHVRVSSNEAVLFKARERQKDPEWQERYRKIRPIVERKIAHCIRKRHGGRNARVRGLVKVAADFKILAAAINLARMARIGLRFNGDRWSISPT